MTLAGPWNIRQALPPSTVFDAVARLWERCGVAVE